jgi:hypothetical protein
VQPSGSIRTSLITLLPLYFAVKVDARQHRSDSRTLRESVEIMIADTKEDESMIDRGQSDGINSIRHHRDCHIAHTINREFAAFTYLGIFSHNKYSPLPIVRHDLGCISRLSKYICMHNSLLKWE